MNAPAQIAQKSEIRLSDYTAPEFDISHVDLKVRLDGDKTEVISTLIVEKVSPSATDLKLDGSAHFKLVSVALDGRALDADEDYHTGAEDLTIHAVPDSFDVTIITVLDPDANTRLEGLFRSSGTYCTQCEAEGFRHITYFTDRPDVLSTYRVCLEAEKTANPVLLSNGNLLEQDDLEDGWHYALWEDPIPKPCYLFALVAGDLANISDSFVTKSGRAVELNIYVKPEDIGRCDHAMESLKRSMKWDEEEYGLEYDLDLYNIVAVSDFNMGAMENKGLNVFNTKYVLADVDTATDSDFDHVEGVIAHEYFHNWTGNRVTCRDWFQLSLKEGLTVYRDQQFSSDMTSPAVKRLDDVRVLRFIQFAEDASPLSHPVRPDRYVEINNFYTATVYNKGAEVIRMMATILGKDAFRAGMDLYFERHDGQAVRCEEFAAAMSDASGVDLGRFFRWYNQSGTPELTVSVKHTAEGMALTFCQETKPTHDQAEKEALVVPMKLGFIAADGAELTPDALEIDGIPSKDKSIALLQNAETTVLAKGIGPDAIPSLLRGFSAPVKLSSDLNSGAHAHLIQYDSDPFARWEAAQTLGKKVVIARELGDPQSDDEKVWLDAMASLVMDQNTDEALLAEMLRLPSEVMIGQGRKNVDPVAISSARSDQMRMLLKVAHEAMLARYNALSCREFGLSQQDKATRRLKNVLLSYLAMSSDGAPLVQHQYESATNMTDRMAALSEACHFTQDAREAVTQAFYERYEGNALVIDKWFAAQAMSRADDGIELLRRLEAHKDFSIKNPNRLRSVASTFSYNNPVLFHAADGSGYEFLANLIRQVDAINPQTAARLVAPLASREYLEPRRRQKLLEVLTDLADTGQISDDLNELVGKALNAS